MAIVTDRGRTARARAFYYGVGQTDDVFYQQLGEQNGQANVKRRNFYLALAYDSKAGDNPPVDSEGLYPIQQANIKAYHKIEFKPESSPASPAIVDFRFVIPTEDIVTEEGDPVYTGEGRFSYAGKSWTKLIEADILNDTETFRRRLSQCHYVYVACEIDVNAVIKVMQANDPEDKECKINQLAIVSYLNVKDEAADKIVLNPQNPDPEDLEGPEADIWTDTSPNPADKLDKQGHELPDGVGSQTFNYGYIEAQQNRSSIYFADSTNDQVTVSFILQF